MPKFRKLITSKGLLTGTEAGSATVLSEMCFHHSYVLTDYFDEVSENTRAGIFKESMGARNRGGIGLSYRPARLHRLAEFIPWNRFLGSENV